MEGGSPTIVTNSEGGRTTPSVVAYAKNGDRLVGQVRSPAPPDPLSTFPAPTAVEGGFFSARSEDVNSETPALR